MYGMVSQKGSYCSSQHNWGGGLKINLFILKHILVSSMVCHFWVDICPQLLLHRLASFQRVWSLPPSEYTGKEITALAWRPDGKSKDQLCTSSFSSCVLVSGNMLYFYPPQFWPSASETLSRWSCVVSRKQRSFMCFQCRAL